MPKVSEEYYKNKRKEIVDAAYRVCTRKPISSVEMKDIIEETAKKRGMKSSDNGHWIFPGVKLSIPTS